MRLTRSEDGVLVARSYDGLTWEAAAEEGGALLECSADACEVELTSAEYTLVSTSVASRTSEQLDARLLIQASFGPTRASLAELGQAGSHAAWLAEQMALPPTLHREYLRRRVSPRLAQAVDMGAPLGACEAGSRWRRFAFTVADVGKTVGASPAVASAAVVLHVEGVNRTEVSAAEWAGWANASNASGFAPVLCSVVEAVGGALEIGSDSACAATLKSVGHPPIAFDAPATSHAGPYQALASGDAALAPLPHMADVLLLQSMTAACTLDGGGGATDGLLRLPDGEGGGLYAHDARMSLLANSLEQPAALPSGSAASCPAVAKTFLNRGTCARRPSCAPPEYTSVPFALDEAAIRLFHTAGGRYVYYVQGLTTTGLSAAADSPCHRSTRWRRHAAPCADATALPNASTAAALGDALSAAAASDANPHVFELPPLSACGDADAAALLGAKVNDNGGGGGGGGGGGCFEHVHHDLFGVYDFSPWSVMHPGNVAEAEAGRPNPIAAPAEMSASAAISLPPDHAIYRWEDAKLTIDHLGRLGDTTDFAALPTSVQTLTMAEALGAVGSAPDDGFEACGSPGEAASEPQLGHRFAIQTFDDASSAQIDTELFRPLHISNGKGAVWTGVVLTAPDQLRQRVAWALAQIYVVNDDLSSQFNELYHAYYDIFVRHAFGSLRDVLREVAFSPLMARFLTFLRSRGRHYTGLAPDENFARELMQLFTIGLHQLHRNGTVRRDASTGEALAAYDNHGVVSFARAWTGFDQQPKRGNIAAEGFGKNYVDPLMIKPLWRDPLPKAGLRGRYVGDGHPLCNELPSRSWLRAGAVWRYVGATPTPQLGVDPAYDASMPELFENATRLAPDPASSALYAALCAAAAAAGSGGGSSCSFPAEVVLPDTLACDGVECDVDEPGLVELADGAGGVGYYEFVRRSCVALAFYPDATEVKAGWSLRSCADPAAPAAAAACCAIDSAGEPHWRADAACLYKGERVTRATAEARCAAAGLAFCPFSYAGNRTSREGPDLCGLGSRLPAWRDNACLLQVQVDASGYVSLVHAPYNARSPYADVHELDSSHRFRVLWEGAGEEGGGGSSGGSGSYPTAATGCGGGCAVRGDTCLCNTTSSSAAVFTARVPSREEVITQLFIGSAAPAEYDAEEFVRCTTAECNEAEGVEVWLRGGGGGEQQLDERAVFTVYEEDGSATHLLNRRSAVAVGAAAGGDGSAAWSFRNPPRFATLYGLPPAGGAPASRDALHETDALLEHLLWHPNTAPFIASRLIQRLVTSNPSPRYVAAVAAAFASGTHGGASYSGSYGDLGATVAAILLDSEARNAVLDADPAHGQLREPLLRVTHLLRALEFAPEGGREVELERLEDKIGMMAHKSPTVFNFYAPDYQPPGPLSAQRLVAPEAQLNSAPLLIGYLNGVSSLIRYGLTSCASGFGSAHSHDQRVRSLRRCSRIERGRDDPAPTADGVLSWAPSAGAAASADAVLDELDLLLTAGRLQPDTRAAIAAAYARIGALDATDASLSAFTTPAAAALQAAQLLFAASAEFAATNMHAHGAARPAAPPFAASSGGRTSRPYRAVVVLFLSGGCDSFNLLAPHSDCGGTADDLRDAYVVARGDVAMPTSQLLPLAVPAGSQPCGTFGVHSSLPLLQQLYDAGDASFVANVGPLVEPLDAAQYEAKSRRTPPSLFGHNTQVRATQSLHAQDIYAKGVLGRLVEQLATQPRDGGAAAPFRAGLYSVAGHTKMLEGSEAVPVDILDRSVGTPRFEEYDEMGADLEALAARLGASAFGETHMAALAAALHRTEGLGGVLANVSLAQPWSSSDGLTRQLSQVARIVAAREALGAERDAFFVSLGGFDSHSDLDETLPAKFAQIDGALSEFVAEMQAMGVWDDVVLLSASDFGRTLSSNGLGTDHGWGGHNFMIGGGLNGGKVLGRYPNATQLGEGGALNIGRGRVIPTTSWEAVWEPVAQWMGVEDEAQLATVLPNLANFPQDARLSREEVFA